MRKKTFLLAVFLCFFNALFFISAQPVLAFRLSPVIVERHLLPGDDVSGFISVSNTSSEAKKYQIFVKRFQARGEDGTQDFFDRKDQHDVTTWITPDSEQILLSAQQEQKVFYRLHVPVDAERGGHYAAIFFSETPADAARADAVGVSARIGVLFFLTVDRQAVPEQAEIDHFTVLPASTLWHLPVQLDVKIRNSGQAHIRPRGWLMVKDVFGKEIVELPLNPTYGVILPQSTRRFQVAWVKGSVDETEGLYAELIHEWKNFAFGRYTAEVQMIYGVHDQTAVARTVFWIIPWGLVCFGGLAIVIVLTCCLMIYRCLRKKR